MEQMNRMNLRVDEIQDFVKTNILTWNDNKKGKQVSFSDQLPSQATITRGIKVRRRNFIKVSCG